LRCTLLESNYEYPPRIEKINLNTARVLQKKVIKDRILGKSSGLPEQVFKLPETPVLRGSLKLALAGEEWNEVEDLDSSEPESTHFTLEILKGEIKFGDGIRGKVPREGTEIRVLEYETVRGEKGNLPAGSRWTAKEVKLEGLTISNLRPATGGQREESIAESFERFIRDLRVPYRAVTSADFEYIARETPGLRVAQAKAIPNFDPYSQADSDGSVTLVLIPFSPLDTFIAPPEPSLGFRTAVSRHLEDHRLLGTRVYVVSPEYVRVDVKVTLTISKGYLDENIKKVILGKLNHFLHPAKGGIQGKGWPVGNPVYLSEIYQLIMGTEGVDVVEKISIYADTGAEQDENGDLILASRTSTVYSGEHSVEISGKRR
jgi:predicted phage baseplate assembly protein